MVPEIIGICLVKNEDIYIRRVITNIIDFCDKIIILDNCSDDHTGEISKELSSSHSKIDYIELDNFVNAQNYVKGYAGQDKWIFGVDGDEIYDHIGLSFVRESILLGKYNNFFRLKGYFFHANSIVKNSIASGYMAPPSKDPNKLYNFKLLKYWKTDGKMSLFHSQKKKFRSGYKNPKEYLFHKKYKWKKCPLRCLHTRFLKRSSLENDKEVGRRLNPSNRTSERWIANLYNTRKKYKKGKLKKIDVSCFFDRELL